MAVGKLQESLSHFEDLQCFVAVMVDDFDGDLA